MEEDHLLDISEDNILVRETQESPATFSRNLIQRLGICQKIEGAETVNNNNKQSDDTDEAEGPSSSGVVSSLTKANQALEQHLINPLRLIFKEKARASAKLDFLRTCMARNSFPKGTTPTIPLKIQDAPEDLKESWCNIIRECSMKLTQTLVNYHHDQIIRKEQLAESVITEATQIILPEYITSVPDIPTRIESSIQSLLCEITLSSKNFRKRSSNNNKKTPKPKKAKTNKQQTPPPTPSKNGLSPSKKGKGKYPWRPLKLKKTTKK